MLIVTQSINRLFCIAAKGLINLFHTTSMGFWGYFQLLDTSPWHILTFHFSTHSLNKFTIWT